MTTEAPNVEVRAFVQHEGLVTITLQLRRSSFAPLSPAALHDPTDGAQLIVLHRLTALEGAIATFETSDLPTRPLHVGDQCVMRSWWTAAQLELARDLHRSWIKVRFTPQPALAYSGDGARILGRAEPVPSTTQPSCADRAWDHEHCALCWNKISGCDDAAFGYRSGNDWLCSACFDRYIVGGLGQKVGDVVP